MESALKVFKGRTAFQSLCILKALTGCLNLNKYHSLQGCDLNTAAPLCSGEVGTLQGH